MTPFGFKLRDGKQLLGVGLSDLDFYKLKAGEPLVLDLGDVGVGLWHKEADGTRTFLQPRDSQIVVMLGDTHEEIGQLLRVKMPPKAD